MTNAIAIVSAGLVALYTASTFLDKVEHMLRMFG